MISVHALLPTQPAQLPPQQRQAPHHQPLINLEATTPRVVPQRMLQLEVFW
jgi:hypothetical protein